MLTNFDQTLIAPFAYADAQPFLVQDELGTVVTMPIDTTPRNPLAAVPAGRVAVEDDPLMRLERKLDTALRQIAALQQTIESLAR